MNQKITIVMYHYVRHLARSRFPDIKGLSKEQFERQLRHIMKYLNPIRMEDLLSAVSRQTELPPNACLLTFDDGYMDHFETVFPLLDRFGIEGSFFPPVRTVKEFKVLDVNKIQFILASVADKRRIVLRMFDVMDEMRGDYELAENDEYYRKIAVAGRYDTAEVVFIKRMLQRHLPEGIRSGFIHRLFSEFVTEEEEVFARELYMDLEQIRCMHRHGMFFGGHGAGHYWMDSLPVQEQEREVDASIAFLKEIGVGPERRVFCYPFGGYNRSLIDVLRRRGFQLGLTAEPEVASIDVHDPMALPRLDTNDLPR